MNEHNTDTFPDIINIDQCAELMLCSVARVKELAEAGEIPALLIDQRWIFVYADLLQFLAVKAREEAETRRTKHSPKAPARLPPDPSSARSQRSDDTLKTDVEAKPPASVASDKDQVVEEYLHAGMKIQICRDAGFSRRPTYYAVVINPATKTQSGSPVDAGSYTELRAAAAVRAEHKANLWQKRLARDAA